MSFQIGAVISFNIATRCILDKHSHTIIITYKLKNWNDNFKTTEHSLVVIFWPHKPDRWPGTKSEHLLMLFKKRLALRLCSEHWLDLLGQFV